MIDMKNMSRDFMPRRKRPEEEVVRPPIGQQAPGPVMPPPPGIGPQPVGVSTGQPQPFTPVGGQMPPGGMPQMATTMQPGAPGYEEHMAHMQQIQGIAPPPPGGERPPTGIEPFGPGGGQPQIAPQVEPSVSPWGQYGQEGQTPQMPGGAGGDIQERRPEEWSFAGREPTTPEAGGQFPYPEQWQQAGDIYGQLAGGMPGMPDPAAMWGGYQQQAGDLSRELAEQAGMGVGGRYGGALQRQIADVGMRAGERFGGEMERMRMGDIAGQRQAMLGAAGGLSGLGGAYAMLPGQLSGQAMGLGQQYQGMQQQEYDRMLQEYMRTSPEYNPLLQYMGQGAQVPYGPQTYQPGWGSNMMDIGGMMGMYGMMGGGW